VKCGFRNAEWGIEKQKTTKTQREHYHNPNRRNPTPGKIAIRVIT
jgi:hypothetical protein